LNSENPFKPSPELLSKLGSIVVHSEEMISDTGHHFDLSALRAVLNDPEVRDWLKKMTDMAMVPVKRWFSVIG
jgi:hypothetical protein